MACGVLKQLAKRSACRGAWLACTAITLTLPTAAWAQSVWNGNNSTDWFDPGNWTPNGVPNFISNVTVDTIVPNATVVTGGSASSSSAQIGGAAATAGQVTVTGSNWGVFNALTVGGSGNGTLNVQSGGTVNTFDTWIGFNSTGSGTATVEGAGSRLTSTGWLTVGRAGIGTLNILNGGVATAGLLIDIGSVAGGGGTVLVDGAGSHLNNNSVSGLTIVGQQGNGTLTVQNGGQATNANAYVGYGTGIIGQATVDGTNSRWTSTGNLTIGSQTGATGIVTLRNGGTATANAVQIGQLAGSTGTLNVGAASGATAAAPGTLSTPTVTFGAGTGRIVFNHTASSYDFAPLISGAGTLLVEAGTTTLTANNTYTGATTVNGGTLSVNGAIVSQTTVNTGGTLGGSGTVGNTTISGGTLSPGNSIGTLSVQGNLVFTAASSYLVEIDPNGADRTNVSGTATLGGATVRATYANGSYVTRRYTILNATGGVTGTFNSLVNTNLPANFTTALNYDAANAYLDITLNFVPPPPGPNAPNFGLGLSGNQTNVANALVNSFNTAGGIPLAFGALTAQGLTQISGEAATGTQQTTFNAMDQFITMMTDPFLGTRAGGAPQPGATGYADEDEALAYAAKRKRSRVERDAYAAFKAPPRAAPFERRWSVWGSGYGGTQRTDGNATAGSSDVTSRVYGAAAGFDYRLAPDTLIGVSLGGAGTNYGLVNGLGGGRSEMFQAGAYARHTIGAAYLAAALAYGWQDATTDRTVFGNVYRANFDANALAGRLEGGYRFAYGASGVTPYAAGQFTSFWLPAYAEQTIVGTNIFALGYGAKDVTASRSELGLRGDTSFAAADAILTLRGRAAWAHNFNTDRSVGVVFQTLPASAFVVNGAAQARSSALVSAGAEARWLNGLSVAATFEGEFSNITDSYAGKGTVRYQW